MQFENKYLEISVPKVFDKMCDDHDFGETFQVLQPELTLKPTASLNPDGPTELTRIAHPCEQLS
eukprot:8094308-Lingulodinium_polyedra.AAC.1